MRRKKTGTGHLLLIIALIAFVFILPGAYQRWRYPVRMEDEIRFHASRYNMPPELIAAFVATESSYNPRAVSDKGARGLMQIMPDTGGWIAGKLGEKSAYSPDLLFEAETSLRYGCWYVNFLLSRYDGCLINTIAAYHAGQGKVDEWLKNPEYSDDGRVLKAVPESSPATRNYVNKVKKAYDYYKEAYR
ncbi:MAG: lytic transglycosylase domain-containing protein [Clostridia bacterium]|nr:lytic transglycosylase domain-containing protein [Clostridia bacterium]